MRTLTIILGLLISASAFAVSAAPKSCEAVAHEKLRKAAQEVKGHLLEESVEQLGSDQAVDTALADQKIWYTGLAMQAHHQIKEVIALTQQKSSGQCL